MNHTVEVLGNWKPKHQLLTLFIAFATTTWSVGSSLLAQTGTAPGDSTPKDSVPERSAGCELCIGVALVGGGIVLLAAPTSFLLFKDPATRDVPRLGFMNDHASIHIAGGGRWTRPGSGWVHSADIHVLKGHLYGEARFEYFDFSDLGNVRFETVRAGYLAHAWARAAGGMTIGYRRARGDRVQDALEVGFPTVAGGQRSWLRFEPIYVISNDGVTWNYRLQGEMLIGRGPVVAGLALEAKTVRQGGAYFVTPALVLGTRF